MANQQMFIGQSGAVYYDDTIVGWYPPPYDILPIRGALINQAYIIDTPVHKFEVTNKEYVDALSLFELNIDEDIQPKLRASAHGGGFYHIVPTVQISGILTVGVIYKILDWITDDNFVNVGGANVSGTVFVATLTTPTHWAHSSKLVGYQNLGSAVLPWDKIYGTDIYATGIVIADAGTIGLGAGKGLIQFDDEVIDVVSFLNCKIGIDTTISENLLTVGYPANSDTSTTPTLRLQGYNISDGTHGYGTYGGMILNANSGYTISAHRFLITNALNANKFGIIRSVDALTDPTLGVAGVITSGTADFVINTDGNISIRGGLHVGGDSDAGDNNLLIDGTLHVDGVQTSAGIVMDGNATIGQAAGPLLTFDDTNNYLEITGCNVGIDDPAPGELLDVAGNINLTGVLKVDDMQVVSNRVVDATIDNTIETAFTALYPLASALLAGIQTAIKAHGLMAAA